jgi:hypothetical protein
MEKAAASAIASAHRYVSLFPFMFLCLHVCVPVCLLACERSERKAAGKWKRFGLGQLLIILRTEEGQVVLSGRVPRQQVEEWQAGPDLWNSLFVHFLTQRACTCLCTHVHEKSLVKWLNCPLQLIKTLSIAHMS